MFKELEERLEVIDKENRRFIEENGRLKGQLEEVLRDKRLYKEKIEGTEKEIDDRNEEVKRLKSK